MSGYRFAGWGRPQPGFCEMPRLMVDVSNPDEWYWGRCGSAKPSRCPMCAEVKRLDVASVGRSGWIDRPTARGYWTCLTAPGADVLPWDRLLCRHSAGVKCSGDIGCKSDRKALAVWHFDVAQRWSWFVTDLRREVGEVEFFKTWELQHRGALHIHSLMRASEVSAQRFEDAFVRCALRWGFGVQYTCEQIDLSDPVQVARKAGYCSKYAAKGADDLPKVLRYNDATGEVSTGGLRSWSASRRWGDTMRAVQLRRCQWAANNRIQVPVPGGAAGGSGAGPVGGGLDSYQDHYADVDGSGAICSVSSSDLLV